MVGPPLQEGFALGFGAVGGGRRPRRRRLPGALRGRRDARRAALSRDPRTAGPAAGATARRSPSRRASRSRSPSASSSTSACWTGSPPCTARPSTAPSGTRTRWWPPRSPAPPAGRDPVLVGDRAQDVLGAAAHGLPCIGAGWGPAEDGELEAAGAAADRGHPGRRRRRAGEIGLTVRLRSRGCADESDDRAAGPAVVRQLLPGRGPGADPAEGIRRPGLGGARAARLARSEGTVAGLPRRSTSPTARSVLAVRAADSRMSSGTAVMCLLCQTGQSGDAVSLFTARRTGEAGRNGNTVGTYICADLRLLGPGAHRDPAVVAPAGSGRGGRRTRSGTARTRRRIPGRRPRLMCGAGALRGI